MALDKVNGYQFGTNKTEVVEIDSMQIDSSLVSSGNLT